MMIGLTEPSSGELNIKLGDNWIDVKKAGPLNRGRITPYLGLLHQEYSLYPHRDVLGNLTDAISLNLPAEFAKIKAAHILETVGFEKDKTMGMLNKWPDELSGGEQHRVALAQVLIKEPNIVILDEPTASLDAIATEQIKASIDAIKKGRTVIIISHNLGQIIDADQLYVLEEGRVVQSGKPAEVYQQGGVYKEIFDASARSMNADKIAEVMDNE